MDMAEPVISRGTSTSSMGGEEDGAHAVDAGTDGQGDDDAGPDAEGSGRASR